MLPPDFSVFFTTMAAVGATLFGLIFVAISIAPEKVTSETATLERQIKATTAYVALLNPLMISLFTLVPHEQIGIVVISLSLVGLLNALGMVFSLLQDRDPKSSGVRNGLFIFSSFFIYGFELYIAIHLLQPAANYSWFIVLANLLIFIYIFGVIRAWELIGIRQFKLRDWFVSLRRSKK